MLVNLAAITRTRAAAPATATTATTTTTAPAPVTRAGVKQCFYSFIVIVIKAGLC